LYLAKLWRRVSSRLETMGNKVAFSLDLLTDSNVPFRSGASRPALEFLIPEVLMLIFEQASLKGHACASILSLIHA
jgi:hypothetical protein